MKIVLNDLEPYPKWWMNYIQSFNDSLQFQNECNKMGLKFVVNESEQEDLWKSYELHFPDEQTFIWFVLRWS